MTTARSRTYQRQQHTQALKLLAQHATEKPNVSVLNQHAVIWKWSDGTAVLKSFSAAIAYYDPEQNTIFTAKHTYPSDKPHIKQFKDLMIKK